MGNGHREVPQASGLCLLLAQLVSLASEVQELHLAQRKEMASGFSKGPTLGLLPEVPSLMETFSYSYCYVGIMTGEWAALHASRPQPCPACAPSLQLLGSAGLFQERAEAASPPVVCSALKASGHTVSTP